MPKKLYLVQDFEELRRRVADEVKNLCETIIEEIQKGEVKDEQGDSNEGDDVDPSGNA